MLCSVKSRIAATVLMIVSVSSGQITVPDAFVTIEADLSGYYAGEALEQRPDLRSRLAGQERVVLTGVPVGEKRSFDLELTRSKPFAEGAELRLNESESLAPSTADIFTGTVQGVPGSMVVLGLSDHYTYGMIQHQGGTWIISSGPVTQDGPLMVFDAADAPIGAVRWGVTDCEVLEVPGREGVVPVANVEKDTPECRVAPVAIETDREFLRDLFDNNTAAATDYIALLLAANTEIYTRDLNVRFEMTFMRLWSSSDPWNQGDATSQLFQFRDRWETTPPTSGYAGAHFFSGRSLGGGVAWLSALCYPEYNYALSANLGGYFPYPLVDENVDNWDIEVTAHEWGHNFGAPHTHEQAPFADIDHCGDDFNTGCNPADIPGTIMSYCHLCGLGLAGIKLNFHPQNINNWMLPYLEFDALCDLTGASECSASCPGDIADDFGSLGADGQVSFGDFLALLGLVGPCPAPGCPGDIADDFGSLGGDAMVSFGDFLALLGLVGACP